MMPPAGVGHRANHLALLQRLAHEKLVDPEIGRLLDELAPVAASLDPDSDDAGLLRLARRMHDKAVQVPTELRVEMARASAEANPVWVEAKETSNFAALPRAARAQRRAAPPLRRLLPADRRAVRHPARRLRAGDEDGRGDAHLRRDQGRARPAHRRAARSRGRRLVPLRATSRSTHRSRSTTRSSTCSATGPDSWRIDPTEHPFASGAGIDDIRITTHYYEDSLKSLFSTMHEYGHGLYEHQIPRRVRAPADRPAARRSACTSRRAACGRTSSAGACRSGASSTRACRRSSRSSSAASTSTASTRRSTACSRRSSASGRTR